MYQNKNMYLYIIIRTPVIERNHIHKLYYTRYIEIRKKFLCIQFSMIYIYAGMHFKLYKI